MEDVFKFLLVAAVIVIGLVKQFKKEANKNADKSPDIPMPDVDNPLPRILGRRYLRRLYSQRPQAGRKAQAGIQTVCQIQAHFHKGFPSLPGIPSAGIR